MGSKITRAFVSISLATVCLWLLSSGIVQAAKPAITSHVVQNPAPVFALSPVTPTVQFVTVTNNGSAMLLGTLPVYRVTTLETISKIRNRVTIAVGTERGGTYGNTQTPHGDLVGSSR